MATTQENEMPKILKEKMFGNLKLVVYEKDEEKYGYEIFVESGEMLDFGYAESVEKAEEFMQNFD